MLRNYLDVRDEEKPALFWAFLYFFAIMCGYEILKPIRDSLGISGSWSRLPTLFSATLCTMLVVVPIYSALLSRYPRRRVIPFVYRAFAVQLVIFFGLLHFGVAKSQVAGVFFVWLSVFNLFVVSIFWSFMDDVFHTSQAKRLFGIIAAGGTLGAILGPFITLQLVRLIGPAGLMLVAAATIEIAILCVGRLSAWGLRRNATSSAPRIDAPIGGRAFSGFRLWLQSRYMLGLSLQTILYASTSTFLYMQQLRLVSAASVTDTGRTRLLATIEFGVNIVTLLLQVAVTGRVLRRMGMIVALVSPAVVTALGFATLAFFPTIWVLVGTRALRSAAHFALERPAKEILFTRAGREARFKAKSIIDTAVYRGSDFASAYGYSSLVAKGAGVMATSIVGIPLALTWAVAGAWLARRQDDLARREQSLEASPVAEVSVEQTPSPVAASAALDAPVPLDGPVALLQSRAE